MSRYVTEPDADDDQLSFDSLTRREFGRRAIGDKPCINAALYCQAPIVGADGRVAICYGDQTFETNHLGEMLSVCQRPECGAVRLVPRRPPPPSSTPAPVCPKCARPITGDNEVYLSAYRTPQCAHCKREANRRRRERLNAKAKDAAA